MFAKQNDKIVFVFDKMTFIVYVFVSWWDKKVWIVFVCCQSWGFLSSVGLSSPQSCINLQPLTRYVITTAWRQLENLNPTQIQIVLSDLVEMKCCSIEISSNHVSHFFLHYHTSCFTSNYSSWSEFLFSLGAKLCTITTADVRKSSIKIFQISVGNN